jgi:hypothetical protein
MPTHESTALGAHRSAALENDQVPRRQFRRPEARDGAVIRHLPDRVAGSGPTAPPNSFYERHLLRIQGPIESLRAGRPLAVYCHQVRMIAGLVCVTYDSATPRTLAGL